MTTFYTGITDTGSAPVADALGIPHGISLRNGAAWHAPQCPELPPKEAQDARRRRLTSEEREEQAEHVRRTSAVGIGHNSGAAQPQPQSATVFEQFEAIVDSLAFTAEQKCILVKIRCRVNAKTMDNAIVSNEGLMRAASLKDPRALRAELRDLQGKARDLPKERDKAGRPIEDPIDESRATIVVEERPGKASIVGFTPERLHAIVAAYLQHREQKRRPGRPPASDAPPSPGKPPASCSGGLEEKPPASGTGGLEKPPASHAENPLRQTHPDPFPLSRRQKEGADARPTQEADATKKGAARKRKRSASEQEINEALTAYNDAAAKHGFTPCHTLTDTRSSRLGDRLLDIGGVGAFKRALTALPTDDFLMGRVRPRNGGAPFKLNLERLLSTGSGMGDVLARLIDAAGDAPTRNGTHKEEVQALQEKYPDVPVEQIEQAVIAARRSRGLD